MWWDRSPTGPTGVDGSTKESWLFHDWCNINNYFKQSLQCAENIRRRVQTKDHRPKMMLYFRFPPRFSFCFCLWHYCLSLFFEVMINRNRKFYSKKETYSLNEYNSLWFQQTLHQTLHLTVFVVWRAETQSSWRRIFLMMWRRYKELLKWEKTSSGTQ